MSTPDITSRIQTLLQVKSGDLSIHVGDGLFTFAIDPHGNKSVQLKTADLVKVRDLFCRAVIDWERATELAADANTPPTVRDVRKECCGLLVTTLSITHEMADKLVMNGINSLHALEGVEARDLVEMGFTQADAEHILKAAGQLPAIP